MFKLNARSFLMRFFGAALCLTLSATTMAEACRDIKTIQESANANNNTAMGGHVTQHIYGMAPPSGTTQLDKTLFEAKGKYDAVWRQYQYISNPVNCGGGGQAQQSVSLSALGIKSLGAYSCTAVNSNGECTTWNSYMAGSVFFGFILKNKQWILNTSFPEPLL